MPDTHANLIKQTISNTPSTTGDLTLSTASTGYVGLGASDDGLTYNVTIYASDSDTAAKEVRTGCVYTHSGTSLSRGTLEKSTTGSALDLTSSAVVMVTIPGSSARTWDAAALEHVTGTDANTTMVVNTLYVVDMSAWATADRTYTLPATASVGDRVGIVVKAGDASHELLITAASGDTLNGVSGGTEWSRVFITGETVIMRCVTADATWVVEYDGRIPIQARSVSTGYGATTQSISTATWTTVNANLYAEEYDNSNAMGSDAGSKMRFTARRANQYFVGGGTFQTVSVDQRLVTGGVGKNGAATPGIRFARFLSSQPSSSQYVASGVAHVYMSAGDYLLWYTYHDSGSSQNATDNTGLTYAFVCEVLK